MIHVKRHESGPFPVLPVASLTQHLDLQIHHADTSHEPGLPVSLFPAARHTPDARRIPTVYCSVCTGDQSEKDLAYGIRGALLNVTENGENLRLLSLFSSILARMTCSSKDHFFCVAARSPHTHSLSRVGLSHQPQPWMQQPGTSHKRLLPQTEKKRRPAPCSIKTLI